MVTVVLVDRADELALVHDADPVGQVEHVVDVVADQEDADALLLELRISSRTWAVSAGPSAAVGSSMIRILALKWTARAIATAWRWPPDSDSTGVLKS